MRNSQKIIWTVAFLSFLIVVMVIGYEMAMLHEKTKKHEPEQLEQHEEHSTGKSIGQTYEQGEGNSFYWVNCLMPPVKRM